MSRMRTRARNRRAQLENLSAEFTRLREKPEAFLDFLSRIEKSNVCVWTIARLASRENPLDDVEKAMIAQVVAPHLVRMTPGAVRQQDRLSK